MREFEERFAARVSAKFAVASSSGTASLHLSLSALGIGPGDEVITSAFTFIASANAALYVGALPVFADIDPRTYNIDPAAVEARITSRTKAILPVHLDGNPADMKAICEIADRHGLHVVEDAAQAAAAAIDGKSVGTFGIGNFSLYPTKNITSVEGGMLTTDDPELAERVRRLRNHGQSERYRHEILGYNLRRPTFTRQSALPSFTGWTRLPRSGRRTRSISTPVWPTSWTSPCSTRVYPCVQPIHSADSRRRTRHGSRAAA